MTALSRWLDECERLDREATEGPWSVDCDRAISTLTDCGKGYPLDFYPDSKVVIPSEFSEDVDAMLEQDQAFIIHARTALPAAVKMIRLLVAMLEEEKGVQELTMEVHMELAALIPSTGETDA